jgi:hypothetical protein
MCIQLDFFENKKTDLDYVKEDIKSVRLSSDKVRKSLFARHAELARKYLELHERMEILEKNICNNFRK